MSVSQWSTTPANNNSSPPVGAPEGQTPSSLNNVMRQMMADTVRETQVGSVRVLGAVAGTNTITGTMTPALDSYSAGMLVVFTPAVTNTGATTININGLGALDIFKGTATALAAGDLVAGTPALLLLDSGADDFVLLNPQTATAELSGSFTATMTGVVGTVQASVTYVVFGPFAALTFPIFFSGTSNANTRTITGLPAAVQTTISSQVVTLPGEFTDNNNISYDITCSLKSASPSVITLRKQAADAGFTASGPTGFANTITIIYRLR